MPKTVSVVKNNLHIHISLLAVLTAVILWTSTAWALDLNTARAQGLVGERPDGLIASIATRQTDAAISELIDSVNAQRLTVYRETAAKNGTSVEAVQAVAGEKQIGRAKSAGWFYFDPGQGAWVKK